MQNLLYNNLLTEDIKKQEIDKKKIEKEAHEKVNTSNIKDLHNKHKEIHKQTKSNENDINELLSSHNINMSKIKANIEKKIKEAKNFFLNEKITIETKTKTLQDIVVDTFKEIKWEDVPESMVLTLIVTILNYTALIFVNTIIGPPAGMIVLTLVVAPIIEEMAKKIAIHRGKSGTYLIVFNVVDALSGILMFAHLPIHKVLMGRAMTILMQYTTTIIQKHHLFKDPKKDQWTGYMVSVLIHALFNAVGLAFRK